MIYDFDCVPNRRLSESIKWNLYDPDVLPMWVADMDFVSPEPVIRALRERVEHGVFGYPSNVIPSMKGSRGVCELIVDRLEKRYGWKVMVEDIVLVPGVVTAFNQVCHSVAQPQGEVVVQTPVYPPFLSAAAHAGMARKDAELSRRMDGTYEIDWDEFTKAFSPHTRLFILCNPHNPVGRVFTREELSCMAEICLERGVTICSDEIHGDLIFSGHQQTPIASLDPEIAQHTITLMAPSKTFNLAGLEFSFAVIQNEALRKQYLSAQKGLVGWINIMGYVAAQAAYAEGQEWLDQLLVYLEANRDALYQYIQSELPGITMGVPEGTYLAWLDCREAGIGGNPYEFFLKRARVALNDGVTFGKGGEGFVRLNFGCPRQILFEGLGRIKRALNGL